MTLTMWATTLVKEIFFMFLLPLLLLLLSSFMTLHVLCSNSRILSLESECYFDPRLPISPDYFDISSSFGNQILSIWECGQKCLVDGPLVPDSYNACIDGLGLDTDSVNFSDEIKKFTEADFMTIAAFKNKIRVELLDKLCMAFGGSLKSQLGYTTEYRLYSPTVMIDLDTNVVLSNGCIDRSYMTSSFMEQNTGLLIIWICSSSVVIVLIGVVFLWCKRRQADKKDSEKARLEA